MFSRKTFNKFRYELLFIGLSALLIVGIGLLPKSPSALVVPVASVTTTAPAPAPTVTPPTQVAVADTTITLSNFKNPQSWAAFKVSRSMTSTRMVVTGKLDSYYNYGFKNGADTYWSVSFADVIDGSHVHMNGYVKKDSPEGKQLYAILQDEQPHNLALEIKYLANDGGDGVLITKFVQEIVK
ncbi:MAG TPA: hypothetical protein VIM51_01365 [Desulfosporosinus sp.]